MPDIFVVETPPIIQVIETAPDVPVHIVEVASTAPVSVIEAQIPGPPGGPGPIGQSVIPFVHDYTLFITQGQQAYRFPFAATILGVSGCLRTAAIGSPVVIDINVNGVTIFANQANRPSFAPGLVDLSEISLNVPIVTSDRLTIDIDDVGSTLAGEDLSVFIRYERAV
jgi:hypothetical protein